MCLYNLGRHHDHHNYHLNQMGPSMLKNPLEIVEDNLHYQYHHDQWSLTIIISINDGPSLSYSKSKGTFYDGESSENSRRRPPQQVRWQPALRAPCLQLMREHVFSQRTFALVNCVHVQPYLKQAPVERGQDSNVWDPPNQMKSIKAVRKDLHTQRGSFSFIWF